MKNDILNSIVVVKRGGDAVPFDPSKITIAITKAYIEVFGADAAANMKSHAEDVTARVVETILKAGNGSINIESIQDAVELNLMRAEQYDVARSYILFRKRQSDKRGGEQTQAIPDLPVLVNGSTVFFTNAQLLQMVARHASGLSVNAEKVVRQVRRDLFNGCTLADVSRSFIGASRTLFEEEPDYSRLAARLVIFQLYSEVLGESAVGMDDATRVKNAFIFGIDAGIEGGLLSPDLKKFDMQRLANALRPERDEQFDYLGIETLNDRYFLNVEKRRIEVPQGFFMRVAMGLSLNEPDFNGKAIEFYDVLSKFDFMSSTPTLFNSGLVRNQLASCYLTTVPDNLEGIYDAIKDNALLQKFAGGLGNDWTPVRSLGARIKGTNGESQGVVPFLKVVNDTAIAVNQGGKRKGAVCAYLETWHMDILEFLDLRKNTGDDRRRTQDMNTANWIPDLFMKRVMDKGQWTLFSPNDCPDLHDKYGREFEAAYVRYEEMAAAGTLKLHKTMPAVDLWRKMLTMLFETGHPWITFKDPCNIRSPQQHVGVVHSSNLCTEITLNTSADEIAVCNLGSVNLANHMKDGTLDMAKLKATVTIAVRMLDNVVELNYYSVEKARSSNLRHRPIGLGKMGFQDALFMMKVPYDSKEAIAFADTSMEAITYFAFEASADLARERGSYASFDGSLWSKGILPIDSLEMLAQERGVDIDVDRCSTLDWAALREKVKGGMRNSNCVAIAPTATIGNIVGVDACIEPLFTNLSVKSNLAGEFTVLNNYLVRDLKAVGLWDSVMVIDLKRNDGSIQNIDRIPQDVRDLYKTAFEVGPMPLIEAAARRQKWIDQAQSLNIYISGASGKVLDETYKAAWTKGLKTTYYLRTTSATQAEKSTISAGALNAVAIGNEEPLPKFCSLDDPGCESCQ